MNKQIDIILGLKCNEKCSFCFQDTDYIKKFDKRFNKKDIFKVLIKGKSDGYKMINISGGEPTIYEKSFNYVLRLSSKFLYKEIKVVTNGIKFSNLEFSKKNLAYITDIGLSFHSSTNKQIQDSLTGVIGSYELILNAINNINNFGKANLHNHCVVTDENIDLLEDHTEKIIDLGFVSIHFMSLMHNTLKNKKKTYDFEKLVSILKNIIDKYKYNIKIEISYIQPCYFEGYEEFVLGFEYKKEYLSNNIESLKSWENMIISNKYLEQKCNKCKYLKQCYGFWKK